MAARCGARNDDDVDIASSLLTASTQTAFGDFKAVASRGKSFDASIALEHYWSLEWEEFLGLHNARLVLVGFRMVCVRPLLGRSCLFFVVSACMYSRK